jgi:hypothetical protein
MDPQIQAAIIGAILGSLVLGLIGVAVVLIQEARTVARRSKVLKACLAAEIDMFTDAIDAIIKEQKPRPDPTAAVSTLGTLKITVYPALVAQLGALGPDLASRLVTNYSTLQHLIDRGVEVEARRFSGGDATLDQEAARWWRHAPQICDEFLQILAQLRAPG